MECQSTAFGTTNHGDRYPKMNLSDFFLTTSQTDKQS